MRETNSYQADLKILNKLALRAVYYSTQMIHIANNRSDTQKGDPKVGGHPAACSSSTHILGALHLLVREPQDHLAVKPHASPMDHSYHHMLNLFYHQDGSRFNEAQAKAIMHNLRKFTDPEKPDSEAVFQSYHAVWDPDSMNYFPSGTVGIPPVASAYMALAYRFAADHGYEVPKNAHFWSLMGDSEFREGSLHECMPDVAERKLNHVTWIVDYNRQNLDGARIKTEGVDKTDADRIEKLAKANGWLVYNLRHGSKRLEVFSGPGGDALKRVFEKHFSDFEYQALLVARDPAKTRARMIELEPTTEKLVKKLSDTEVLELLEDTGGHDFKILYETYRKCRESDRPTLVIAHTIKGWHLKCQAAPGNHSALPEEDEVLELQKAEGLPENDPFARFDESSPEGQFLKLRGSYLHEGLERQRELKKKNLQKTMAPWKALPAIPEKLGIDLKLVPWANTQWMWGQLAAKLIRLVNTQENAPTQDAAWQAAAQFVVTMAPDVGTSTNLNPSMDEKVYGPDVVDYEERYQVKDQRRPDLVPLEKQSNRHLRFEIEEANAMTCVGSFGKLKDILGIPLIPMMSVYDFFIKRALDQLFYNVYWKSGFILIGTPSGVSLSPEGAQHSWKSDLQIPNLITWEPAFVVEMDWILAETIRRHLGEENQDRQSVLIRAVTMGLEQKLLIENLRQQKRFQGKTDPEILEATRQDCLAGGYWVRHFDGSPGYEPGDNVITLVAMGTLVPEALKASDELLKKGIYANVLVATSPELLCGNLGEKKAYQHLRETLGLSGHLYITGPVQTKGDLLALRGSRIPIVSTHDGEPGLLDNLGSIIGVPHKSLAVRKHSKSGRPVDVFAYHHLDASSIAEAAEDIFGTLAREEIFIAPSALEG